MSAATEYRDELIATANAISAAGKGILAADESTGTIGKRFTPIGLENNEVNRQRYRQLLFQTPGLEQYISGVILFDETIRQSTNDGKPFVDVLREKGIYAGIKVDKGVQPLFGTDGETVTQGIDGLADRCKEYYRMGARFAKWRNVLQLDPTKGLPSNLAIADTVHTLARYASICQSERLVPIVEPEIVPNGKHDIAYCAQVTERVLAAQFKALADHHI